MRTSLIILSLSCVISVFPQNARIDTVYYDKDGIGVSNAAFASYYRVYAPDELIGNKRRFRDFYSTGELKFEGEFISIDKYDDAYSVFDGECISYYKSGSVKERKFLLDGVKDGEYTSYFENGLIEQHYFLKNGKKEGIFTFFEENGNKCTQLEMHEGMPLHDYCFVSDKNDYFSKVRLSDNVIIWDTPEVSERKSHYQKGERWYFYNKNGVSVAVENSVVKDYGKWYRIKAIIANHSMMPFVFDPARISAIMRKSNGKEVAMSVFGSDAYMQKVKSRQNFNYAIAGIAEALAAANAAYSTSVTETNTSYSGSSNSYGNAYAHGSRGSAYGSYSGSSTYRGHSSTTSRTVTYDGAAAYQAQVIASNRMADLRSSMFADREAKWEGYLKKTTLYPGEVISGYINIRYMKGKSMKVIVDIYGAKYTFDWRVDYKGYMGDDFAL